MSMTKLKTSNRITKPTMSDSLSAVSDGIDGNYPNVRRRISKACNYCRQRKIKCNGNSPCLNCKNHHIDCQYSNTIRKKKKQATKKLTLQDLEKRMNKMDVKFEFLNEKLTTILSLLNEKNLVGGVSGRSDSNPSSSTSIARDKKDQGIKIDDNPNNNGITSSEDEDEEEEDNDDDVSYTNGEVDDNTNDNYDELIEDEQQLLSPLSNISNSESLSSVELNQQTTASNNYVEQAIDSTDPNNFTNQNQVLMPLGGIISGNGHANYTLNSQQFDNTTTFSHNSHTTTQANSSNTGFDFSGDNKLNYLYSEVPLIGMQIDAGSYDIDSLTTF